MSSSGASRKCSFHHQDGRACRAWALRGSDPPRCVAHQGDVREPQPSGRASVEASNDGGPRVGNKNRQTHGFHVQPVRDLRDIDDVVEDALFKQTQLSAFIEEKVAEGEMAVKEMARLLALHGQNAARIGRLLRDQRALSGKSVDGLLEAIGAALDELSTELGIDL